MPYRSLRDFIARLEAAGELVRVREPVSTALEMTEIQTRLIAESGPAVIFEKPIRADGAASDIPVLVNLFGTVKRVAMGVTMGGAERGDARSLREVGELLATLRQPEPPRSLSEAMALLPLAKTVMSMRPKTAGSAACQQIVLRGAEIDLNKLPIQTCWPGEPAPLITWPLVVTKGPSGAREDNFNLGIYRMQVWIGSLLRSISAPRSTICWHAAEPAVLGRILITVLASGNSSMASESERGGSG